MEYERKLIRLKGQEKLMTLEEVYMQFRNFLYKSVQSWKVKYDIDDLLSVAFIGLNKAYKTYDSGKDILFMTYLVPIVNNELRMYERKEKKYLGTSSLDELIPNQKVDSEKLTLMDLIADEVNYEDKCIDSITYKEVLEIVNSLNERDKKVVVDFYINNKKQDEIGKELGMSQSYMSRLLRKIPGIIRKKYEGGGIMKVRESKITREQLWEEAKIHGTGREAIAAISKKYGLTERTVDTYLGKYGIRNKFKAESVDTPPKETEIKPTETKDIVNTEVNVNEEPLEFKTKIPNNKVLQPLLLRGKVMEYKVQENSFAIRNITGTTTIALNANEIDDFIKELEALKDVV